MAKKKAAAKEKVVLGWHFLPKDMKLGYGDDRKAKVGETLTVNTFPDTCHSGLHASHRPAHAAHFKKGPIMCRVQVWGDIDDDGEKFAGKNRHVLWAKELTTKDLRELYKHLGISVPSSYDQSGLVHRMGELNSYSYADRANKWLEDWANKHGAKGKVVEMTFTPKKVTEADVKKFLSPSFLRTIKEIAADMGEAYDCDGSGNQKGSLSDLEDALDNLVWGNEATRAEDWKQDSSGRWQYGYALTVKRKR